MILRMNHRASSMLRICMLRPKFYRLDVLKRTPFGTIFSIIEKILVKKDKGQSFMLHGQSVY